jgi:hypothetical protein
MSHTLFKQRPGTDITPVAHIPGDCRCCLFRDKFCFIKGRTNANEGQGP